ncbi:MAG: hypothetical protein BBJ57_06665 [Desulfobacterales bacterium PC51MH44]|nr:MAG: hypothetical protein BBJ57_06665 [Desulfobacterales bacterium PC51MH44]
MTKIVNLLAYRTKAVEQRGFGPWNKRFGESYCKETRLSDISDRTLYLLALPGEDSSVAFYEMIMGVLDLGGALKFYYLDKEKQMMVMDIHFFLVDQVRFEMMRRLGWLDSFNSEQYSLLEMVQDFDKVKVHCKVRPPELTESHPDYGAYRKLTSMDRETFIRRMLPTAIETFKDRLSPNFS